MSLKDQFAADVGVFLNSDEFSEVILYTVAGGTEKSIPAIVEDLTQGRDPYQGGVDNERILRVTLSRDATAGIANPSIRDSLVFKTLPFKARQVVQMDDALATLEFTYRIPEDHHPREHRRV